MENNINKIDLIAPDLIIKKRKSPLGAIICLICGVAIAALRYLIPSIGHSPDMASAVMIVGWGLALLGIIMLMIAIYGNSWRYFYKPTGEKIVIKDFSFDPAHKDRICRLVGQGDFDAISQISRSDISAVKLSLCTIDNKDIVWAQVFEFVPHTHVPVTGVMPFDRLPLPKTLA